jgi:DNA-binding NtrC family response regulator
MPKWNILVVEDDYALQQLYQLEFSEADLGIIVASNGLEACKILINTQVDLVITDIKMPEAGGDAVMDCIEWNRLRTPIIVVSAFSHYREIFKDERRTLVAYFLKPVDFKELVGSVRAYLEGAASREGKDQVKS